MKQYLLLILTFFGLINTYAQCETFHTTITSTSPTCVDYEDGGLTAYPVAGTSPYTLEIYNEGGFLLNPLGGAILTSLGQGWYYIHAEDNIGCVKDDTIFIADPTPLTLDYSTSDPSESESCDGFILVDTVYGDYETLTYYWAPNPSGSTDSLLNDACYGSYLLVVTNENGCYVDYSIDLALYLNLETDELNTHFTLAKIENGLLLVKNESEENALIVCYSLSGQFISNSELETGVTYLQVPQENGLFFYQIIQNGQVVKGGKMSN